MQHCRKLIFDDFDSGYGDDPNPYTETVEFLDDLVMEFITDMTQKSMEIGRSGRVQVEDIIFLVRKQPKMCKRNILSSYVFTHTRSVRFHLINLEK